MKLHNNNDVNGSVIISQFLKFIYKTLENGGKIWFFSTKYPFVRDRKEKFVLSS